MIQEYPYDIEVRGRSFPFAVGEIPFFTLLSPESGDILGSSSCRGFMVDVLFRYVSDIDSPVLNYKRSDRHQPSFDQMRLRVEVGKNVPNSDDRMEASLEVLNNLERSFGISPSICRFKEHVNVRSYIFLGSRSWMVAPPMISLYTLVVRLGWNRYQHDSFQQDIFKSIPNTVDELYLEDGAIANVVDKLKNGGWSRSFDHPIQTNFPKKYISQSHGNFGIHEFAKENCRTLCPHWYWW